MRARWLRCAAKRVVPLALLAVLIWTLAMPAAASAAGLPAEAGFAGSSVQAPARPTVPSAAPGEVADVCPPADPGFARCFSTVRVQQPGVRAVASTPAGYGPAQYRGAYGLSAASAPHNEIVAIVDAYDNPWAKADLDTYSTTFGIPVLPTCTGPIASSSVPCFQKVDQNGGTSYPVYDEGWAGEIALDIQVAHAICQNCRILLVEATTNSFTNLLAAVDRARLLGAHVISNSYGAHEFSGQTTLESHFNYPGIAFTVSTGDHGYADGPNFPAASRFVTAVGGTRLSVGAGNTYAGETVWNDNDGWAAGSGCSAYTTKPSFQTDTGCARRTIGDVSADATSAAVYISGQGGWFVFGGTSLSSPLIGAVYGLAGGVPTGVYGNTIPYAYGTSANLRDVISGNNGSCSPAYLCSGAAGYDGPTGRGSPNGLGAFTAVAATPPTVDDFASATPITALPAHLTANTDTATTETSEQTLLTACTHASTNTPITKTVWYRYTAGSAAQVTVTSAGSDFDTILAVYTGSSLASLSRVTCDDDAVSTSGPAALSFQASAGTTYYMQAGGWNGDSGNLVLDVTASVPSRPANDAFSFASAIPSLPAQLLVDTVNATTETGESTAIDNCHPGSQTGSIGSTVWYKYVPLAYQSVTVATTSSSFGSGSPSIAVYTGTTLGNLAPIDCQLSTGGGVTVPFTAAANQTYYIRVGGLNGASGTASVSVTGSAVSGPANDLFSAAAGFSTLPAQSSADTTYATIESGEPTSLVACGSAGSAIRRTVWYTYNATTSGQVRISTAGSSFQRAVAVYTGSTLPTLSMLACQQLAASDQSSSLTLNTTAGTAYRIQVGSPADTGGDLSLQVTAVATQPAQVQSLNAKPLSTTSVRVQWEYSGPAVDSFRILRWTGSDWQALTPLVNGAARSWDLTGLQSGIRYEYTVDAINSVGEASGCSQSSCLRAAATTYQPTGGAGVSVSRLPGGGAPALTATLAARPGCGAIDHIVFVSSGQPFNNAKVTVTSPAGGPSNQTGGFTYAPPSATASVTVKIERVAQSGGATVSPVSLFDGCGEWHTLVGGGAGAFN